MNTPLIICADATSQMGTGHVIRCMALAEAWNNAQGHSLFISHCPSETMRQWLHSRGHSVVNNALYPDEAAKNTITEYARRYPRSWIVLDGYHFDTRLQDCVRRLGSPVAVIDDLSHLSCYSADLIINANIYAHEVSYSTTEPAARILRGTRYAFIRKDFLSWRCRCNSVPSLATRMLVTMGGSDPQGITFRVMEALNGLDGLSIRAAIGPSAQVADKSITGCEQIEVVRPSPSDMPLLMSWADFAISAGGSTCYELMFMGIPNIVIVVAENQRRIADGLDKAGTSVNLGWYTNINMARLSTEVILLSRDECRRRSMSWRGRELVDGLGARRVVDVLSTTEVGSIDESLVHGKQPIRKPGP